MPAILKAYKSYTIKVYKHDNDEVAVVITSDSESGDRPAGYQVGYFKCELKFVDSELIRRGYINKKMIR